LDMAIRPVGKKDNKTYLFLMSEVGDDASILGLFIYYVFSMDLFRL